MLRLAIVGGNWNNTLLDGPFYANLNNTASNSNWNNGAARLLSIIGVYVKALRYPLRLEEMQIRDHYRVSRIRKSGAEIRD